MVRILRQVRGGNIFFIVLGLFTCIIALAIYSDVSSELQLKMVISKGRIVSCHWEASYYGGSRVEQCQPTVGFLTASGEKIEFVSSYAVGSLLFYPGKEVTVNYNPDKPRDALITSVELWIEPVLYSILGLIYIGIGVIEILVRQGNRI